MSTLHFKNKLAPSIVLKGFTLVELLVVIAIIGILASSILTSTSIARRKSRDARRIVDIKQIQLALDLYFDGIGAKQYPVGVALDSPCSNNSGLTILATKAYIMSIPHDPFDITTCYRYASQSINGNRTNYHLGAVLEDNTNTVLLIDKDCDDTASGSCGVARRVCRYA